MRDRLRLKMLFLNEYQQEDCENAIRRFIRMCVVQMIVGFALAAMLIAAGDISGWLVVSILLLPFTVPFVQYRGLDTRIAHIKLRLLLELPVFVSKLLLFLQAGQTLHNSMMRCAESYAEQGETSPLGKQMAIVRNQLRHGFPFARVIEDLARRCGTQEITFFTSAVLMNYRRGGDELVTSLRSLSRELWEKRKTAVKTLGEQASAKMIFPLIVVFIAVMITIGAPAIMQLG